MLNQSKIHQPSDPVSQFTQMNPARSFNADNLNQSFNAVNPNGSFNEIQQNRPFYAIDSNAAIPQRQADAQRQQNPQGQQRQQSQQGQHSQQPQYQQLEAMPAFESNRHLPEDRYQEARVSADTAIYQETATFSGPSTETNLHSPIHTPLPFLKGGINTQGVSAYPVYQRGSRLLLFMGIFIALSAALTLVSLASNQFRSRQVLDIMGGGVSWGPPAIAIAVNLLPNLLAFVTGLLGIAFWAKPRRAHQLKTIGLILSITAGILVLAAAVGLLVAPHPDTKAAFLNGFIVSSFRLIAAIFYTLGAQINVRLEAMG